MGCTKHVWGMACVVWSEGVKALTSVSETQHTRAATTKDAANRGLDGEGDVGMGVVAAKSRGRVCVGAGEKGET